MNRESSPSRIARSDFRLLRPAAALVSLGMVLPEYLLVLAVSAFFALTVLAIVQTINRCDRPRDAQPRPATPRRASNSSVRAETAATPSLSG